MKALSVLIASVGVAAGIPISMAVLGIGVPAEPLVGYYSGGESKVQDPAGDAEAVLQTSGAPLVPDVRGHHDILAATVRKAGDSFTLTVDLAGDPNVDDKLETNYMWHLVTSGSFAQEERHYIVMIFNFAPGFNHTFQGWYYAVFDSTNDSYVLPQTAIEGQMPDGRVEYSIHESLIGYPSNFRYWVSVYSRVDSSSFDDPPEYLMDHAP